MVTIRAAPQRTPPSARRPTASLRPSASVRPSATALDTAKNAVVVLLEKERKLEMEIERRCIARSGLGGTTPTATKQAKNVADALAASAKVSSHLHATAPTPTPSCNGRPIVASPPPSRLRAQTYETQAELSRKALKEQQTAHDKEVAETCKVS